MNARRTKNNRDVWLQSSHSRYRSLAAVTIVAMVALLVAACGGSGAGQSSKPVLTIGIPGAPPSLNPTMNGGPTWQLAATLTNATFTHQLPDGSYGPELATSWRYVGNDHETFEFTLRHGVKFSDGTPLDAAAVVTWFNYFWNSKTSNFIGDIGDFKSAQAVDKYTVRINLGAPNLEMVHLLGDHDSWWGMVSSPKAVADPKKLNTGTYGAGPYVFDKAQSTLGQTYVLVPNKYYYDKSAIKWSKVVIKVFAQPSTLLQAMRTGQVDVGFGDGSTWRAAEKIPNVKVEGAPSQAIGLILLSRNRPPLSDVRVRQALNYAIDRKTIIKSLFGGLAEPGSSIMSSDAESPEATNYYTYDPAKARQLLAAAGYPNGFTLSVIAATYTQFGLPLDQAIASYWQKIGVKTKLISVASQADGAAAVLSKKYDANSLNTSVGPFQLNYWSTLRPGGGSRNVYNVDDPGMDALWRQALAAKDPGPILQKMNLRATEQGDIVSVGFGAQYYYVRTDKVAGVVVPEARQAVPFAIEWSPAGSGK